MKSHFCRANAIDVDHVGNLEKRASHAVRTIARFFYALAPVIRASNSKCAYICGRAAAKNVVNLCRKLEDHATRHGLFISR